MKFLVSFVPLALIAGVALADSGTRLTATVDAPGEVTASGASALVSATGNVISSGAVDTVDITVAIDDDAPVWIGSLAPDAFIHDGQQKVAAYQLTVDLAVGSHDVGVCFNQRGARAAKSACAAFSTTVLADPSGGAVRPGGPGL